MKITVICVGKIKEAFYRNAIGEYVKRLGRYTKLEILEVADEKTPDHASEIMEDKIRQKEGERAFRLIPENAYVIALAIEGKEMSSEELANNIHHLTIQGESHLVFLIGGSLGMCPALLQKADLLLSFSRMTFPHQLMRVILLEQIYRSFRIIHGDPYHI